MYTKFYQNQLAFVEDTTKTFWCVLSVHIEIFMKKYVVTSIPYHRVNGLHIKLLSRLLMLCAPPFCLEEILAS